MLKDLAARGKTSVDWFYGFKLHLVVNDCGELLNVKISADNVDDRAVVPNLVAHLFGKISGDRNHLSHEFPKVILMKDFNQKFFDKTLALRSASV